MADDIVLSEEEVTAILEAAKVNCQEAVAAFVSMTPEQKAAHETAQAARMLETFLAMTPEQQAALNELVSPSVTLVLDTSK